MKISANGIRFIKAREGNQAKMYKDSAGLPTIGVGHLLTQSELTSGKITIAGKTVLWRNGLTDKQITALLDQDLDKHELAVSLNVKVKLTQNQFDALVSFSFNVGTGAFLGSNLLKQLNAGHYEQVPIQLKRWVYSGGEIVAGLATRRELEGKLWQA